MSFVIQDNCASSQGLFYVDSWGKDSVSTVSKRNAHKFRTIERANEIAEKLNNDWGKNRFKVISLSESG